MAGGSGTHSGEGGGAGNLNRGSTDPLSASAHFPSRHSDPHQNIGSVAPLQLGEMKKFEELFIDSQRKHSAPVANNQRHSSESLNHHHA